MDIIDNRKEGQFEVHIDGQVAKITYEIHGKKVHLFDTRVPESLAGQGIGSAMVTGVLERIEKAGMKVIPVCTFVQQWFMKHPEKRYLLA